MTTSRWIAAGATVLLASAAACRAHRMKADSSGPAVDTGAVRESPNTPKGPPPPGPAQSPALSEPNILALMTLDNQVEVQDGTAAGPKATKPDVKAFAHMLVADHTQLQAALDTVVRMASVTPAPAPPADTIKARMQAIRDSIGKLSGAAFDRAFIETQVAAHEKAVDDLNHFATLVSDSLVRNIVVLTDRRVEAHLKAAENLLPVVGGVAPTARPAGGRKVRY